MYGDGRDTSLFERRREPDDRRAAGASKTDAENRRVAVGDDGGAHVGVDLLFSALGARGRRLLFRLQLVLIIVLMAIVTWNAVPLAERTRDQLMPTLDLSVSIFYFAVIFCGVHSILHCLRLFRAGEPPVGGFDEA